MSLIVGYSVIQAAPSSSGLRRGKQGTSSQEIVEASMVLNMSLSGMLRLNALIISSSAKKDCNEALELRVPTIRPHDGSKHVDGKAAGQVEVGLFVMVTPVQFECDEQKMCRLSRL
jgi:hypothetical protein